MNYNEGAYNKPFVYDGIPFGNYNVGAYNSGSSYNQQFISSYVQKNLDLFVNQGTRYYTTVTIKDKNGSPINLTDCSFTGSIYPYEQTSKVADFVVYPIDMKVGKVAISMGASSTIKLTKPRYVYKIDINTNSGSTNILRGQAMIFNG